MKKCQETLSASCGATNPAAWAQVFVDTPSALFNFLRVWSHQFQAVSDPCRSAAATAPGTGSQGVRFTRRRGRCRINNQCDLNPGADHRRCRAAVLHLGYQHLVQKGWFQGFVPIARDRSTTGIHRFGHEAGHVAMLLGKRERKKQITRQGSLHRRGDAREHRGHCPSEGQAAVGPDRRRPLRKGFRLLARLEMPNVHGYGKAITRFEADQRGGTKAEEACGVQACE